GEHGDGRQDQHGHRDHAHPRGRLEEGEARRSRGDHGGDGGARFEARRRARRERRVERRRAASRDRAQTERREGYAEEDDGHRSTRTSSIAGPSSFSTVTVKPSMCSASPAAGTRPSRSITTPAMVASSSDGGIPSLRRAFSSPTDTRPLTMKLPGARRRMAGSTSSSSSSRIAPNSSSRRSSIVTSPTRLPYSSSTSAMCTLRARNSRNSSPTVFSACTTYG